MTGNFTLKSLIAAMQLELNWYSKHFTSLQTHVKSLVKKAIEGELTDYDFDTFFSTITRIANANNDAPGIRRARNTILHILRLEDYSGREILDDHALVGYHNVVGDTAIMTYRVIEEILSAVDLTMVRRFYSDYNAPKEIPWRSSNPRFETLCWFADDIARRYPSGLQILIEEPRLTDEFSTELYREFDEIIGAMEKLNADPKLADDGTKGYRIGYHNSNYDYGSGDLSTQLRKLIDTDDKSNGSEDDASFEERESVMLSRRDNSPEGYLVNELTDKNMVPSVLKAIASATLTKRDHDKSGKRGGALTSVKPGYFADLNYDAVRAIYNEGISPESVDKVLSDAQYYVFIPARVDFEDGYRGNRLGFGGRKINSVARAAFGYGDSSDTFRIRATEKKPISAYLDQVVDFDFATKNDGLLKVSAINGYYSYYRLLSNIVFKDFGPLLYGTHNETDNKLQIRRQLTRIKSVPLRKVWELPLIVNPFRTPEEIFADLGYELHEVSEPNAKAEAPVRKPGSKRK